MCSQIAKDIDIKNGKTENKTVILSQMSGDFIRKSSVVIIMRMPVNENKIMSVIKAKYFYIIIYLWIINLQNNFKQQSLSGTQLMNSCFWERIEVIQ